jgi:prepilin-type N-terminal cleavage/methylation domain-containing protein
MIKLPKNIPAFTLIELMIVVVLIAILSGVVMSVLNSAGFRAKARDNQRYSDLKMIQSALEAYFADNRSYPSSPLATALSPKYLNTFPTDPSSNPATSYSGYIRGTDGYTYTLYVQMEELGSNSKCQANTTTPNNSCTNTELCCVFKNP